MFPHFARLAGCIAPPPCVVCWSLVVSVCLLASYLRWDESLGTQLGVELQEFWAQTVRHYVNMFFHMFFPYVFSHVIYVVYVIFLFVTATLGLAARREVDV